MKKPLFQLYNSKTQVYSMPQPHLHKAEMFQAMDDAVNATEPNRLQNYPEEYAMFEVGTFDDMTGKIELSTAPIHVLNLVDVVRPKKREPLDDQIIQFVKEKFASQTAPPPGIRPVQ